MRVFSLDAETDDLYGGSFAIAVTVRKDGREVAQFSGRIPDREVTSSWVKDNVLPALGDMPVTHSSQKELEEAFWVFWREYGEGATVIAHVGSPVESGLFRRCVERNLEERAFQGPYPLHEVGTALLALGKNPASVDSYVEEHGLVIPFKGETHHPMYDAVVSAVVWEHAMALLGQ